MRNLLCPTDFSRNAHNAIVYGLTLIDQNPSLSKESYRIVLMHNVSVSQGDALFQKQDWEAKEWTAKEKLANYRRELLDQFPHINLCIDTRVETGQPVDAILNAAHEERAELIVMGSRGKGIGDRMVGSVSAHVLTRAVCNALLIPDEVVYQTPDRLSVVADDWQWRKDKSILWLQQLIQHHKQGALHWVQVQSKDITSQHAPIRLPVDVAVEYDVVASQVEDESEIDFLSVLQKHASCMVAILRARMSFMADLFEVGQNEVGQLANIPALIINADRSSALSA